LHRRRSHQAQLTALFGTKIRRFDPASTSVWTAYPAPPRWRSLTHQLSAPAGDHVADWAIDRREVLVESSAPASTYRRGSDSVGVKNVGTTGLLVVPEADRPADTWAPSDAEPYVARAVTVPNLELCEARGRTGDDMSTSQPRAATVWLVPREVSQEERP
jgi:hypothetical protein